MKKKIALVMTIIALLAIAVPGSLAYFTAEDTVHNVITSDSVKIRLEEYQQVGNELQEYPGGEIAVMPGTTVSKIPMIKNLEAESYIRAKIQVVVKDSNNEVMDLDQTTLDSIITIAINTQEGWVRKDGDTTWWYHEKSVGTDESTAALFKEVVFSGPNMTNEYQGCRVEITVIAQAVQAAHTGDSALEVPKVAWPVGTEIES